MIDKNRPYSRIEIDKQFKKVKDLMHRNAVKTGLKVYGEKVAYFEDVYTGEIFKGGDNYEFEHIRSSENLFMKFRETHTDKEIALIVNHPDNVSVTHFNINRHKDKFPMEERILNYADKIKRFKIDIQLTLTNLAKADKGIEQISLDLIRKRK